ncbi:acyl-CoA N-acyltransferase [Aaosphaeria arxii CBS 175.79]|uniref:Acyl-CoA N-acyltransferase n=1 Tax=Aaosphaeria arxii CBS 175.79 TaxID=1450172 RepID=A0A6A5Y6D4_9PLEO|nr:acyl-CoA N-acyltransferase [Aaosphaeria arxii CBS 175.79]KAF2020124.1 acyl-CoA N-acyltransferase [Aaosphaeria arxii CBS 175.79]
MATNYEARDPFRSERLVFRAVQTPQDDELFRAINDDRIGYQNSNASNNRLPGSADAAKFQKQVAEDCLMGAVICLASPDSTLVHDGTPIGQINLKALPPGMQHHRFSEIAIDVLPDYQGKGYGGEAIRWALDFAFRRAGLHRVKIRAFGWNTGAVRLYEKIGFKHEGRQREELWHDGSWWDGIDMGILESEWRELRAQGH